MSSSQHLTQTGKPAPAPAPAANDARPNAYRGQFSQSLRNGYGKYVYNNGAFTYQGEWKDGKKNGYGRLDMRDGSFYEGDFVDGEIDGRGFFHSAAKANEYKGQFKRGDKHGHGVMTQKDGTYYEGDWSRNMYHGKGCLRSPDGTIYVGDFQAHKRHGQGKQKYPDGAIYSGSWSTNVRQGFGKLKFPDGKIYEGDWELDSPNGSGTMRYPNGSRYESVFVNGFPSPYPDHMCFVKATGSGSGSDPSCCVRQQRDSDNDRDRDRDSNSIIELRRADPFEVYFEIRDSNDAQVVADCGRELQIRLLVRRQLLDLSELSRDEIVQAESHAVSSPMGAAIAWPVTIEDNFADYQQKDGLPKNATVDEEESPENGGIVRTRNGVVSARVVLCNTPAYLKNARFTKATNERVLTLWKETLKDERKLTTTVTKNTGRKSPNPKRRNDRESNEREEEQIRESNVEVRSGEYLLFVEDVSQPPLFLSLKTHCIPMRVIGSDIKSLTDSVAPKKKSEKRWNTLSHIMGVTALAMASIQRPENLDE